MTQDPALSRGEMRASDADRQLVIEVLHNAYVDGRLTKDELDDRLGQVASARTFNDLAPITHDLVEMRGDVTQYTTAGHQSTGAVVDTSHATPGTDTINSWLGTTKRLDGWRLRGHTSITTGLGDVKLDLTKAVIESPQPQVHVSSVMGDVTIRVPEGVEVISSVNSILGDVSIKGARPGPHPGVVLTLTGFTLLGDVKVIGPDHVSFVDRLFGKA